MNQIKEAVCWAAIMLGLAAASIVELIDAETTTFLIPVMAALYAVRMGQCGRKACNAA